MAQIVGTANQDHYKVLGIERDATHEDIKRSYRQLVMENHPDTEGGDADTFLAVQAAYEVLGNQDDRAAYDASVGAFSTWPTGFGRQYTPRRHAEPTGPTTLSEELHGMKITVEVSSWGRRTAIVSLAQFAYLVNAHGYGVFSGEFQGIRIVDGAKTLLDIHDTYSCYVEKEHADYQKLQEREKNLAAYRTRLASCEHLLANMPKDVLRYEKLDDLVWRTEYELEHQGPLYTWRRFDPSKLASLLNRLEHALERLNKSMDIELLALGLMQQKFKLPCVAANQEVIDQLLSLSIQTSGYIEALSDDALVRFYKDRLRGAKNRESISLVEAYGLDLMLKLEEYAPAEILAELELLPDVIDVNGVACSITYRYIEDEKGKLVAAGIIEVPISHYQKLAPEYAKASKFPELPNNLRRYLVVLRQGEFFAAGFDTVELAAKVQKMVKGRRRTADAPSAEGPTAPPPWYQGKAKAGRRR